MAYTEMNAMTATNLAYLIKETWAKDIFHNARREAFFDAHGLVGTEGMHTTIVEKYDPLKEPMDTIHMMVVSRLLGAGTTGETLLQGNEEKLSVGQFDVTINWLRHAVAITEKANKAALIDAILMAGKELAPWLATKMSDDIFASLLVTANEASKVTNIYADEVASTVSAVGNPCALVSASTHTLDLDDISMAHFTLTRKGAIPFKVTYDNGMRIPWYGMVIDDVDAYRLKETDAWKQAQRDANLRGETNRVFTGALGVYGGMIIFPYSALAGEKGTPIRPEAALSIATTAGANAQTITVGADTKVDYTRNFPTSGMLWTGNPVDNTDAEIAKVAIPYSSKTNNTFVCTVVPGATYEQAAIATIVTLENTSRNLCFGAEIAARGWGLKPTKMTDNKSYGQHIGVGIKAVYGLKAIENSDGNVPNALILQTYAKNPGTV